MNLKNAFASVIISTIFVVSSAWSAWAFPVEGTPAAAPFAKSCQSQPLEDSQRDLKSNKANSQSDTKNQDLAAQKADKGNKAANVPKTTYKPSEQDMEDALNMLDKAVILVKTEAREKAKPGKITNDAFKGMMMLLEDSKVDSNIFNDIDEDSTPEAANKALRSQFTEAAKRYPNLMKDQKLTIAALRGIMYATGDPYTVYMDPEEYKNLNEQMSGGNFGGVGIVMQLSGKETDPKKDRVLVIQRVMDMLQVLSRFTSGVLAVTSTSMSARWICLSHRMSSSRILLATRTRLTDKNMLVIPTQMTLYSTK